MRRSGLTYRPAATATWSHAAFLQELPRTVRDGLRTFGGSEGVGIATTEAVVGSLFAVIVLQFLLSAIGYVIFPA